MIPGKERPAIIMVQLLINVACLLCEVKTGEIRRAQVNTRLSFLKTEGCPVTGKELTGKEHL